MSKESKQLATNDLDEQKETSTFSLISLIFIGASILVIMLGLMTGSFKVSITDGVSIDTDVLVPSIITNIDKFEKVEIAETMAKGMVAPIEESQEESLKVLLAAGTKEIYLMDLEETDGSFSFCELDSGETAAEKIRELGACRFISNTELDASGYAHIKLIVEMQPSLKPYVVKAMEQRGELTYIDRIRLDSVYEDIKVKQKKAEMVELKDKLKLELGE